MGRIKVAAVAALITVGVMLLLAHPEILTAGASVGWGYSYLGYHVFVRSYVLDAVEILIVPLGLIVICVRIRQRIKQKTVWKRRCSMRSIDGGKWPRSEDGPSRPNVTGESGNESVDHE